LTVRRPPAAPGADLLPREASRGRIRCSLEAPSCFETALAERLGLERTTLVRNLKTLVEKGWIEPVPGDGRGLRHRLTPAGQATLEAAIPLWEASQRRVEDRLVEIDPEGARRAMRALRKASYGE